MKDHPIPPDESSWGTFDLLIERNQQTLRDILQDAQAHQNRSAIDQKIGGFYQSCMNEPLIEERATAPLQSELDRIAHISNRQEFLDEVVRLQALGINVFFNFSSEPDPNDALMTIAALDQAGLGLPEKDYSYERTRSRRRSARSM